MVFGILKTKDYCTFELCGEKFEGAQKANHGLPGDVMSDDFKLLNRANHNGLVGVLELTKSLYGFTTRNLPIYLFVPWNESYPPFYVGSSYRNTTKNVLAIVDFESWYNDKNCPRGFCREIIGPCGDLESEEIALLIHLKPKKWKRTLPILDAPLPPVQGGYKLEGQTFHIDPPGCRDIDDAVTLWQNGDGSIEVRIHIADVASILSTNEWLWESAAQSQTIYKDGAVVAGLFPSSVEENLSLLPGKSRMTLTLGLSIINGNISDIRWFQQEIEVKESYTYDTILLSKHYVLLREVTSCIAGKDVVDPHDWVAELMLFYNKEAAKILHTNGVGILRRHSAPDMKYLATLEQIGKVPTYLAYSSGEYCRPTDDTAHWGLGTNVYCHATSPIRRWVDCVNQGHLMNILFSHSVRVPVANIDNLNIMGKTIKKYERDLTFLRVLIGPDSVKEVSGIVVDSSGKLRIWVEAWKQIVIVKGDYEFLPGTALKVKIFFDAGKRNWKRRMVFAVEPTKIEVS